MHKKVKITVLRTEYYQELAEQYDIYYTVHIQDYGWLKWTKGAQDDSGIC